MTLFNVRSHGIAVWGREQRLGIADCGRGLHDDDWCQAVFEPREWCKDLSRWSENARDLGN